MITTRIKEFSSPLKIFLFCSSLILLSYQSSLATHYRYGSLTWREVGVRQIEFRLAIAQRFSGNPPQIGSQISQPLNYGDGSSENIMLTITSVSCSSSWFYAEGTRTHVYANDGDFVAFHQSCCRISTLVNNADRSIRFQTVVNVGANRSSPVSTLPAIVHLPSGNALAQIVIPAMDADSPVTFRLANGAEMGGGSNPTQVSITADGTMTFNTVGLANDALYNVAVTISDGLATTTVDFIVRIVGPSTPPFFDYAITPAHGTVLLASIGDNLSFQVRALDTDPGSICVGVVGVPPGAVFSAPLPLSGNPVQTTFSWTPQVNGVFVIQFIAEDDTGGQTLTSVTIHVAPCGVQNGENLQISQTRYNCATKFSVPRFGGCKLSYIWDFGDGTSSTERSPIHAYGNAGTYSVSLTLNFQCGSCSSSLTLTSTVQTSTTVQFQDREIDIVSFRKNQVVSVSASSFSDGWSLEHKNMQLAEIGTFNNGSQGVWRNEGVFVYDKSRSKSENTDISKDGTFTLDQFNWQHADLNAVPNWIKANSITQYSPNSYETENKDVLGIYSAAVYDYFGQLPAATAANARHNEIAFTSFEHINGSVAGNWIMHTSPLPVYNTYVINGANSHMAIVEASLAELSGVTDVDVIASETYGTSASQPGYTQNQIVCITQHPENPDWSVVVLRIAPSDGVWIGQLRVKNVVTPIATFTPDPLIAHSGKSSLKITADKTYKQDLLRLQPGKKYLVSCWMSRNNPSLTTPVLGTNLGIDIIAKNKAGTTLATFPFAPSGQLIEGWQQLKGTFLCPLETEYIEIKFKRGSLTTAWFDDLRIQPENSQMKGYVYDPATFRLRAILDEENYASYFYYDVEGNLYLTKKETIDGIKTLTENISYQVEATPGN